MKTEDILKVARYNEALSQARLFCRWRRRLERAVRNGETSFETSYSSITIRRFCEAQDIHRETATPYKLSCGKSVSRYIYVI